MLALLDVGGRIVTADAMHIQRSTSEAVCARGGDHVLALKGNQGTLFEDATRYLDDPQSAGNCQSFQSLPEGRRSYITTRGTIIENSPHWVLDVTMNEDQARNRTGNEAKNQSLLRRMALNLARTQASKGSMRGKIKKMHGTMTSCST